MIEKPHNRSGRRTRGEYAMELLHIDDAGPFDEGLDGSRYWLTVVDDFTGWIEIVPIPRRQEFVIESLLSSLIITNALNGSVDEYASTGSLSKWEKR